MTDLKIRVSGDAKARGLALALKARAPGLVCPVCRHRDFGLLEQPGFGLRTWLRREGEPFAQVDEKTSQPLLTLVCTNCGHIEQFAEAVLDGADPALYGEVVERD